MDHLIEFYLPLLDAVNLGFVLLIEFGPSGKIFVDHCNRRLQHHVKITTRKQSKLG